MIRILFSEVCNRKSTQRSTFLFHNNMYWKYLGKLTKSDYYIIKRKDSMLIIRRGGTFLPTPGHVRVKTKKMPKDDHIKRPLNCFMLYSLSEQPKIVKDNLGKTQDEISSILGKQWKTLSPCKKEKYQDESKKLKKIHAAQYLLMRSS